MPMYRAVSCGKEVSRIGSAEERTIRPDGRGELPVGRRRGRRGAHRGRGGDHAGGPAGRPGRRRGRRAGLSRRCSLGGGSVAGARLVLAGAGRLLAAGYPTARPDDGPRGRSRRLPAAAVPGPGVRRPACRDDAGGWSHTGAASGRPGVAARPPAPLGAARLAGSALVAGSVGPGAASPPPLTAGPADIRGEYTSHTTPRQRLIVPWPSSTVWSRRTYLGDSARAPGICPPAAGTPHRMGHGAPPARAPVSTGD